MEYAYLGSNAISLAVWVVLFWRRPDLRAMMLVMSVAAMPLALFDLVFVPSYWTPLTLFNIPVGIEGFLFAFSVGGIAAVLYAELTKRVPQHVKSWRAATRYSPLVLIITFVSFVAAYLGGAPNPEIAAYIAIAVGVSVTIVLRPDLRHNIAFGALAFGIVYFVFLKVWMILFPGAQHWFTFQHLPRLFIWGVPGWEAIFGFFFGAFWSNMYELLFGYHLVPMRRSKPFQR